MNFDQAKHFARTMVGEGQLLFLCQFGSDLYGTNTSSSDTDYLGVYIPSEEQPDKSLMYKTAVEHTKNTSSDIDITIWPLTKLKERLMAMDIAAIDMIFADEKHIVFASDRWKYLKGLVPRFITATNKSYIDYAFDQAGKYGIVGSRLGALYTAIECIMYNAKPNQRLGDIADQLPTVEDHIIKTDEYYIVLGRKFDYRTRCKHHIKNMVLIEEQYGERARRAMDNDGVDWKALSHALRACYEFQELLITGKVTFPLPSAHLLKMVKDCKFTFAEVGTMIEQTLDLTKQLHDRLSFPTVVTVRTKKALDDLFVVDDRRFAELVHADIYHM